MGSKQKQQAKPSREGEAAGRGAGGGGWRRRRAGRLSWAGPCAHLVCALRVSPGPAGIHPDGCAAFAHFGSAYPKAPARLPMISPELPLL
jgi:hypothetical protein